MSWAWLETAWKWVKIHWGKVLLGALTLGAGWVYITWRNARAEATQAKIDLEIERSGVKAKEAIAAGNALDEVRAGMERARAELKEEAKAVDAATTTKIQEGATDGSDRIAADFNKRP